MNRIALIIAALMIQTHIHADISSGLEAGYTFDAQDGSEGNWLRAWPPRKRSGPKR
jgi:hypothetical protein